MRAPSSGTLQVPAVGRGPSKRRLPHEPTRVPGPIRYDDWIANAGHTSRDHTWAGHRCVPHSRIPRILLSCIATDAAHAAARIPSACRPQPIGWTTKCPWPSNTEMFALPSRHRVAPAASNTATSPLLGRLAASVRGETAVPPPRLGEAATSATSPPAAGAGVQRKQVEARCGEPTHWNERPCDGSSIAWTAIDWDRFGPTRGGGSGGGSGGGGGVASDAGFRRATPLRNCCRCPLHLVRASNCRCYPTSMLALEEGLPCYSLLTACYSPLTTHCLPLCAALYAKIFSRAERYGAVGLPLYLLPPTAIQSWTVDESSGKFVVNLNSRNGACLIQPHPPHSPPPPLPLLHSSRYKLQIKGCEEQLGLKGDFDVHFERCVTGRLVDGSLLQVVR